MNNNNKHTQSNRDIIINIIIIIAIELLTVFIANSKLAGEDDLFWYLSTGRYIVQTGTVPSSDVFGFTTAGIPWIPYEWGWDVLIYYIYSAGGYIALHVLSTLIILTIVNLILYNLIRLKVNYIIVSIIIPLLLLGAALRFSVKPHLVSYLCITLLLTIIIHYRYINRNSQKILFFIPLIFIVWINMHMGIMAGFFLLGLYFLSEAAGTIFSKKTLSKIRPLTFKELSAAGIIILVSAIVTLINPHGIKTYEYAFKTVSLKQLEAIYEWISPLSGQYLFTFQNYIYYVFIIGIIPVFIYSYKQKDFLPFLLSAGFFLYSSRAIRFVADFMLVTAIFIPIAVDYLAWFKTNEKSSIENFNKAIMAGVIVLLVVMIPGNYLYKITGHPRTFGFGIDESHFPVKLFSFLESSEIINKGERPFNSYETGGYFAWNFPGKKGFIGSRTISDSVWNEYTQIINIAAGFEEKLNKNGFDYFIWSVPFVNYAKNPALLDVGILSYLFKENNTWKLVYWTDNDFLFIKNEPKFKDIINSFEYKYLTPYNLYFDKKKISNGLENDRISTEIEINRKLNEDSKGIFTQAMLKLVGHQQVK